MRALKNALLLYIQNSRFGLSALGILDILHWERGKAFAEVKRPGEDSTRRQKYNTHTAGVIVAQVTCVEEVLSIIAKEFDS